MVVLFGKVSSAGIRALLLFLLIAAPTRAEYSLYTGVVGITLLLLGRLLLGDTYAKEPLMVVILSH